MGFVGAALPTSAGERSVSPTHTHSRLSPPCSQRLDATYASFATLRADGDEAFKASKANRQEQLARRRDTAAVLANPRFGVNFGFARLDPQAALLAQLAGLHFYPARALEPAGLAALEGAADAAD